MSQTVQIRLTAKDLVSPELNKIKSAIKDLGTVSSPRGNNGGTFGSVLFGSLTSQAIMLGVQGVTSAITGAGIAIREASNIELSALSQAGTLATKLGMSFKDATGLARDMRIEISKVAASLPGSNQDYKRVFDNIAPVVSDFAKGDQNLFKQLSMELTKRYGVLFATSGADSNMGGMALGSAIGGTRGLGELFTIDGFQRNPVLVDNIRKGLKEAGVSESQWKEIGTDKRLKILLDAAKRSLSDETIRAFDGSMSSMIETIRTNLFDPDVGVFGFMRSLESKGGRTAFDSIKRSFSAVLGLFEVLGRLGKDLGISFDPMLLVTNVSDWFADFIYGLTGIFNGADPAFLSDIFDTGVDGIVEFINSGIDGAIKLIGSADWNKVGEGLGRLAISIWKGIWKIDWASVARLLAEIAFIAPAKIVAGYIYGLIASIGAMFNDLKDKVKGLLLGALDPSKVKPEQRTPALATKSLAGLHPFTNLLSSLATGVSGFLGLPSPNKPNSTSSSYSPQVNIQATSNNPQEIANAVISALDNQYKQYQAQALV